MSPIHAVIIAGGEGRRLGGVRKADLRIGGSRLLERLVQRLACAVTEPILVATGPAERRLHLPSGCAAVPDLPASCAGPLAGLAAAIAWLADSGVGDGLLVSVAVDTPFLPADFVARLAGGLGEAPAAFAAWGDDFYPPNAIWRIEALIALPRSVAGAAAPASLKALQRQLGAVRVDWADSTATNPFANINTVADLVAAQRIARG